MNRLILLGNGFDLAHQLKTSYNDFILQYLKKAFTGAEKDKVYEDGLLKITKRDRHPIKMGEIMSVNDYVDHFYEKGFKQIIGVSDIKAEGFANFYRNPFKIEIKNYLIEALITNCSSCNWVDIENEFYELLKSVLSVETEVHKREAVAQLNEGMGYLIKELHEYLSTLPIPELNNEFEQIFRCPILHDEVVSMHLGTNPYPTMTMVLNFNYTNTVEPYLSKAIPPGTKFKTELNYIHGKLKDLENPLIFGFGDELDKDYINIELDKTKGFFNYIKSFWYFSTTNYHSLIRFIDHDDFQVFIMGHSCGLSDRTMLNMIFEHKNCKSIKIYYYQAPDGSTNFSELTQEISRHFTNKSEMRRRIVPLKLSRPMPQVNKST